MYFKFATHDVASEKIIIAKSSSYLRYVCVQAEHAVDHGHIRFNRLYSVLCLNNARTERSN